MRQQYGEIKTAGGETVVVGFAPPAQLEALANDLELPFPVLHDPTLDAYRAFGIGRGSRWAIYGPSTIVTYISLLLRGRRLRHNTVDRMQLGGDFVIDGEGVIRFANPGSGPAARPTVDRLIDVLRELADQRS